MNIEEIEADIQKKAELGIIKTRDEIYNTIHKCLRMYYGEFDPNSYIRTFQLLNSLVKVSGGLHAEVYFDAGALNYKNGTIELKHTPTSGIYGFATWGSGEVLDTAMHGSHGGYVGGTAIWDDSMAELGDIVSLIVKELKAAGLPIH